VRYKSRGIRVGVVGVGYWGSRHVRVLRSTIGVSTVISIDQQFADSEARSDYSDSAAFADIDDALDHVDAVVIATPPSSHAELGLRAISAGKHVLIEKPLATSTEEARHLVDAAAAAQVLLMPGHTFEFNAAVQKLRDLIQDGDLGEIYFLESARLNLGLYQSDVNVIVDLAPHDISIANFVLGATPTTVSAWGSCNVLPELADDAYVRLEYSQLGVCVNIHVSWLNPVKVRRMTAVGSRKMAVYDDMAVDERIRIHDKSALPPQDGDGPLSRVAYQFGDVVVPFVPFAEPLAVQDQYFVDCIANASHPATNGTSGLEVVQVLQCAQISMREQRPVALTELSQPAPVPAAPSLVTASLPISVSAAEPVLKTTVGTAGRAR
jgi:predicted dehydrogenase